MNLFSLFDPVNSFKLNMFLMMMTPLIICFLKKDFKKKIFLLIEKELYNNMNFVGKMLSKIIFSVFSIFVLLNLLNLMPYTFILTSMVQTNLSVNLCMWFSFMLMSFINFLENFFIKLTPPSTPIFLMPFMVLIELISILIRPLTLTMRLTANMISGHILMLLLSSFMMLKKSYFFFSFFFLIILSLLETSMAFIQAFIIMTLLSLFMNEIK